MVNVAKEVERLYIVYSDDIYRYIIFICKDSNKANDILQNTFLNVFKGIKDFKNNSSIKTWLFTIARNECYKFLKKNKEFVSINECENISYDDEKIENYIIKNDEVRLILKTINSFDEELRTLMVLRLVNELSYIEIANILNRTEVWARVNFLRAKKRIINLTGDVINE